jgi:hypothetical protein
MIETSGGRANARQAILQDVLARNLDRRGVGSRAPKFGPPVQAKNGSILVFNSNVDVLTILDSLGRVRSEQTRQASGS